MIQSPFCFWGLPRPVYPAPSSFPSVAAWPGARPCAALPVRICQDLSGHQPQMKPINPSVSWDHPTKSSMKPPMKQSVQYVQCAKVQTCAEKNVGTADPERDMRHHPTVTVMFHNVSQLNAACHSLRRSYYHRGPWKRSALPHQSGPSSATCGCVIWWRFFGAKSTESSRAHHAGWQLPEGSIRAEKSLDMLNM